MNIKPQHKVDSPKKETRRNNVNGAELTGTVFKALAILDLVMGQTPSLSAAEITQELNLARPTTNRIIFNLIKLGYLKRDGSKGELIEGDRLLKLSLSVLMRANRRGPRHHYLQDLAEKTQETCNVGMIVDGQIKYIDRVEAQWPLSLRLDPGSMVPLHCSALGKVLLSLMNKNQREKYITKLTLTKYTSNTITDIKKFNEELDKIAKQGYSLDNEEYLTGVVGMAVPIPRSGKEPLLAIAVAAPSARINVKDLLKDLPVLREVAEKLALCY